jgi:uncharacterized membrane protein YgcG
MTLTRNYGATPRGLFPDLLGIFAFMLLLFLALPIAASAQVLSAPVVSPATVVAEIQTGDLNVAHGDLLAIVQAHPDSAKAWFLLADVDARMGDRIGAATSLANARQIDPTLTIANRQELERVEQIVNRPVLSAQAVPAVQVVHVMPVRHSSLGHALVLILIVALALMMVTWIIRSWSRPVEREVHYVGGGRGGAAPTFARASAPLSPAPGGSTVYVEAAPRYPGAGYVGPMPGYYPDPGMSMVEGMMIGEMVAGATQPNAIIEEPVVEVDPIVDTSSGWNGGGGMNSVLSDVGSRSDSWSGNSGGGWSGGSSTSGGSSGWSGGGSSTSGGGSGGGW